MDSLYLCNKYYDIVEDKKILQKWKESTGPINLYIHSPFCASICKYCNYKGAKYSLPEMEKYYTEYLPKDIEFYSNVLKEKNVNSAYFGGGTVSMVPIKYNKIIFDSIPGFAEIDAKTFEIHPGLFDYDYLPLLWDYGFRFLVVCVQTFDTNIIISQNRTPYTISDVLELKKKIDEYGFYTCLDLLVLNEDGAVDCAVNDIEIGTEMGFSEITVMIDFRYPEDYNRKEFVKKLSPVVVASNCKDYNGEYITEETIATTLKYSRCLRMFKDLDYENLEYYIKHLNFTMTNLNIDNKPNNISVLGIGGYKNKVDTFSIINRDYLYIERNDNWNRKFYEQYDKDDELSIQQFIAEYFQSLSVLGPIPNGIKFEFVSKLNTNVLDNGFRTYEKTFPVSAFVINKNDELATEYMKKMIELKKDR